MISVNKSKSFGKIKTAPEDFQVEEIEKGNKVLEIGKPLSDNPISDGASPSEGDFSVFVLQKTNWNTVQALIKIAKIFRHGKKSVGFAGTKDRNAVSTQMCSIFKVNPSDLLNLHVKDININGAWFSNTPIKMGDLLGNRFTVTVRDLKFADNIEGTDKTLGGLFPNYYGEQRFGMHGDNFDIGFDIIKGDYESAVMKFLTNTTNETNESAIYARKRLLEDRDFKSAFDYYPKYLKYEKMILEYLSKYPENYANSLRKLPRQLLLMFVHSVDSTIFNKELEERVKSNSISPLDSDLVCPKDGFGYPDMQKVMTYEEYKSNKNHDGTDPFIVGNIVGYNTKALNDVETGIMGSLNLDKGEFKIQGIPELACNGNYRVLFAPYNGFSYSINDSKDTAVLKFSLFSGSYATALLNEFLGNL
ncbi:tRNA pseudouridine synthase TruD [Candidatus Mancarchaeum acidiphilum]|uniref:tRNA pseudouridine synthase TruD n=1 Tax=Candidatus Mancarchaeum acidiphilum TaxID=1920749 RepID=A0A218NNW9_9ARCH|nr:tRNA pseudouridine(13) synthase TruD [Candidatus Mancarchaeum acidiphilum]ASI14180.1 tRNA pseudouridine synthase TruD [Candidatus Mancarchaeum acidiphilum]